MARVRISTTVDEELLSAARAAHGTGTDAALIDQALRDYLAGHRRAEIDAAYARSYRDHPIETPDEWGDLPSWQHAAAAARGETRG